MLNELQNLVPSEKEMKLQVFIHQLTNDLYNNEKIEVDSQRLLELLSYLTSNENISSQMKTATEFCNRNIVDIVLLSSPLLGGSTTIKSGVILLFMILETSPSINSTLSTLFSFLL